MPTRIDLTDEAVDSEAAAIAFHKARAKLRTAGVVFDEFELADMIATLANMDPDRRISWVENAVNWIRAQSISGARRQRGVETPPHGLQSASTAVPASILKADGRREC